MITFYRSPDCKSCQGIEDYLQDMTLAHKTIEVTQKSDIPEDLGPDAKTSLLVDEGQKFQGAKAIIDHLDELGKFKKLWEKYQSDACYCEDDDAV